jgi:hypothetical protein
VLGIRQHIQQQPGAKGKTLNLCADHPVIGKYRFSALATDLDLSTVTVWRIYPGRAGSENRIKELKYDFAADSFNLQEFGATETAMNAVMITNNLSAYCASYTQNERHKTLIQCHFPCHKNTTL